MIELARRHAVRRAKQHLGRVFPHHVGPGRYQKILQEYRVSDDLILEDGKVPVVWWEIATNFGDLLSPWLVSKMTGREVVAADGSGPNYVTIGSIISHAFPNSILWGTGSFGIEARNRIKSDVTYTAVRGPLTRARLLFHKAECPEIYGDPALLLPLYYMPKIKITHEFGVIVRHSEKAWAKAKFGPGVKIINYGRGDIEGVVDEMLSCRKILSSSLHGLIVADAYGIPNAWIASGSPLGGEFKFHDYFASVKKYRDPHTIDLAKRKLTVERLRKIAITGEPITFNYRKLLNACPFLEQIPKKVS